MSHMPNMSMPVTKPILPPAATTGTGFGGGFKRFVFGFLLMAFLQVIGLVLLERRNLDPMIVIYAIVGCAGVQGLLLLAWLNYTAARVTGVREVTVAGAFASAVLAAMLVVGGWWGGFYVQDMKLPDPIVPYAWAIPAALAGVGYWIAVKLGFKAGVFRTFLTMLVGFGLPTAAVLAVGKYVPQQACERTEPLRSLVRWGVAGLNMFNLEYKLRTEYPVSLPANLATLLPASGERPQVTNLWPAARVREGMQLVEDWNTYAAGKPVGDYEPLSEILIAYSDSLAITSTTQPAESANTGHWVISADGKVGWKYVEEYNKLRDTTRTALQKGPSRPAPAAAPPVNPAVPPRERTVPVPAPQNTPTGAKAEPGELFPQVPGK